MRIKKNSDMELQKAILAYSGNESFKENSRVGKETAASPTLSELMDRDDVSGSNFAGLGTDVWIIPRKKMAASFTKGIGLYKGDGDENENHIDFDELCKNGTHLTISDNSNDDESGIGCTKPLPLDNPFVHSIPITVDFDLSDHLRSACKLAKCILPYGSNIPLIERYEYALGKDISSLGMKKPWRYYHIPSLEILSATHQNDMLGLLFVVNGKAIGSMTCDEYLSHLTCEKWESVFGKR